VSGEQTTTAVANPNPVPVAVPISVLGQPATAFTPMLVEFQLPPIDLKLYKRVKLASLPDTQSTTMRDVDAALAKGDFKTAQATYRNVAKPDQKEAIRQALIGSKKGWEALAASPELAGDILSAADPEKLKEFDLSETLGQKKNDAVSAALMRMSLKGKPPSGGVTNRDGQLDPALFKHLATQIKPDVWNDVGAGIGAKKRGLGARVCNGLWNKFNFDQICDCIDAGVNTSLPFNVGDNSLAGNEGVWSGFVQPMEHVLGNYLQEVGEKQRVEEANRGKQPGDTMEEWQPDAGRKTKIEGAEKVFAHLQDYGSPSVLTSWKEVAESDLVDAFRDKQGTIWGFEQVRMPYVQAAHDEPGGDRPVRMMELWESIAIEASTPAGYEALLKDPRGKSAEYVEAAIGRIKAGKAKEEKEMMLALSGQGDFIDNFRRDATAFLMHFAQEQMPKGAMADFALTADGHTQPAPQGTKRQNLTVSDIAGIDPGKMMGSFACKVGLWWAEERGEPVYYCLDGIKMEDVCNYKVVKNAAIDEFIQAQGAGGQGKPFMEVITLCEVREIIKNWTGLKGTVVFTRKGKIIPTDEVEEDMKEWKRLLQEGNAAAKRTPAPPKANFKVQLDALKPGLFDAIPDTPEGAMDARDVVKKSGYLAKVAGTNPKLVLKYVMGKCVLLVKYGVIDADLPAAAAALQTEVLKGPRNQRAIESAMKKLEPVIGRCSRMLQASLTGALVDRALET
jgi:hypothetical protein